MKNARNSLVAASITVALQIAEAYGVKHRTKVPHSVELGIFDSMKNGFRGARIRARSCGSARGFISDQSSFRCEIVEFSPDWG
jgi:hypothetical protein